MFDLHAESSAPSSCCDCVVVVRCGTCNVTKLSLYGREYVYVKVGTHGEYGHVCYLQNQMVEVRRWGKAAVKISWKGMYITCLIFPGSFETIFLYYVYGSSSRILNMNNKKCKKMT